MIVKLLGYPKIFELQKARRVFSLDISVNKYTLIGVKRLPLRNRIFFLFLRAQESGVTNSNIVNEAGKIQLAADYAVWGEIDRRAADQRRVTTLLSL
jgi:hypothetical protein